MRIEKREYEVFRYTELQPAAKDKAVEQFHDINVGYEWWDCVYDEWKERLLPMGYYDVDISFSGFWSQGDGASFTGKVDITSWIKHKRLIHKYRKVVADSENITAYIKRSGRYVHERSISLYLEYYGHDDAVCGMCSEIEGIMVEEIISLNKQIYKDLEETYYQLTEKKAVEETITLNEYDFLASGAVFNL